jgi:CheY-like chemotaxis protein
MTDQYTPRPVPTALIIDDNYFNRDVARIALEGEGFIVTDLEDPQVAANLLNHLTFDLLILDLQMPVMDGREVLRRIRVNPLHRCMKIIIMTANAHMETPEIQEAVDFNVMFKPIDISMLAAYTRRIYRPAPDSPIIP